MATSNPLNIETVTRVNPSQHRLQFTIHYDQIPVVFDVAPCGQPGDSVEVPKIWCDPRPSTARLPAPSVLEMIAPHLKDPDSKEAAPWRARRAEAPARAETKGGTKGKRDTKGKDESDESGIPTDDSGIPT